MRRVFIAIMLSVSLVGVALPHSTHAANLPAIIPNCDQTQYRLVANPGPLQVTVKPEQYGTGKQYDPKNWEILSYETTSPCTLNNLLEVFVNLFSWGLYVVSVLALFFFFLGGGVLLLSGGSAERVKTGKTILVNTVIGLFIALGSWVIVNLVTLSLLPDDGTHVKNGIAYLTDNQPWFKIDTTSSFVTCGEPAEWPCKNGSGTGTVGAVQKLLHDNVCDVNGDVTATGIFDDKTLAAWHLWQSVNGVSSTNELSGWTQFTKPCVNIPNFPS